MKYLLTGAAAIVMLTACGNKDKPVDQADTEIVIDAANDITLREGDPATAPQALTALSLDGSSSGRVSFGGSKLNGDTAVFTDVLLRAPEDDDDDEDAFSDGDLKAGKIEFTGLAMVNGQPSFSRMLISDVTTTPSESEDARQNSVSVASVDLVNPSPEVAAWVASLFSNEDPGDLPEGDALSFDLWSMDNLQVVIDEEDGEAGIYGMETVFVSGMKDQKAARMLLHGMTFDFQDPAENTNVKANLGDLDMRGFDFSVFAPEEGDDLEDSFESGFMAGFNPKDPANPGYDSINLKDLNIDISGANLAMAELISTVSHDSQGRAVKIVTDPTTLKVTAGEGELGEQLGAQLATLGYESVELSMASEQTYDPNADIVTLAKGKNYWELKDGFRLDYAAKYEGASALAAAQKDAELDSDAPGEMLEETLENLLIHSLDLSLNDNGIVDRAFNSYAAQSGDDPQELRNQVAGMMAMAPMMMSGSGMDMELLTEASTALSSFITNPQTLTISLKPQTPLKVSELADMEDPSSLTKSSLGFSAANVASE